MMGDAAPSRQVRRRPAPGMVGRASPPEAAPMIDDLERPEAPGPETPPAPARKRGGGPRTPEGKEQSKRNALKHGMRAKVLLPDDLASAVAERTAELAGEFLPGSPYEEWLVGQMALASARLDPRAELALPAPPRTLHPPPPCSERAPPNPLHH